MVGLCREMVVRVPSAVEQGEALAGACIARYSDCISWYLGALSVNAPIDWGFSGPYFFKPKPVGFVLQCFGLSEHHGFRPNL